jgi:serine/threonine protein kinase
MIEVDTDSSSQLIRTEYDLAGYTFEREIGSGSSAVVVQMSKDGVSYAVKICDLRGGRINFMQVSTHDPKEEAVILRKFDHPHIVKIFDLIEDQDMDTVAIVMELLSGGTIMDCETFESKRVAFSQALSAIQYIHFQRIAHRDIKTGNIMRHEDGTIRLVDFGIALFVPEDQTEVPVEDVGTPAFMAPEMFTATVYDPFAADIWALGVALHMALFRKLPFPAEERYDLQHLITTSEPEFPGDGDPDAMDLIAKMLQKNPTDRIPVDDIFSHPYVSPMSHGRLALPTDSQIFKSLSSRDRTQSIMRISGSLRGSGGSRGSGKDLTSGWGRSGTGTRPPIPQPRRGPRPPLRKM